MHNSYRECPIALRPLEPLFCIEIRKRFRPSFCTAGSSKNIICAPFSSSFYYFSNDTLSHGRGAFKVLNLTLTAPIQGWGDEIPSMYFKKYTPTTFCVKAYLTTLNRLKARIQIRLEGVQFRDTLFICIGVYAGRDIFIICDGFIVMQRCSKQTISRSIFLNNKFVV